MIEIRVEKEDLLRKLRENRTQHVQDYEQALEGYRESAKEELEQLLADLAAGKDIHYGLKERKPTSNEDEYTLAIEMFEMSVEGTVSLDEHQFRQYIKDQWDWSQSWKVSNTRYITKVGGQ